MFLPGEDEQGVEGLRFSIEVRVFLFPPSYSLSSLRISLRNWIFLFTFSRKLNFIRMIFTMKGGENGSKQIEGPFDSSGQGTKGTCLHCILAKSLLTSPYLNEDFQIKSETAYMEHLYVLQSQ